MGAGPLALFDGAVAALAPARVERLALSEPLPVVLTGNCHTQQAVVAGVGADGGLGLIWFDCHADFHTPDSTPTGFFDGCGLAMCVGEGWATLCATVPGFTPLAQEQVILAGARDFDPTEHERLATSDVIVLGPRQVANVEERLGEVERSSLHVDLDVLDPSEGRANRYAVGPGLTRAELLHAVRTIVEDKPLAALTLSAYDPAYDDDGRIADTAREILALVA